MIAPVLDDLARQMPEVTVGKVNVDEQARLANTYAVSSIPTLIVFKNGQMHKKAVGYHTIEQLKNLLA